MKGKKRFGKEARDNKKTSQNAIDEMSLRLQMYLEKSQIVIFKFYNRFM